MHVPRTLWDREVGHHRLTENHIVETMHERKALMARLCEGFVAMPGGIGTMEELFEVWTWAQLGLHEKPCGLLDIAGYYAPLVTFLDHAAEQGFVPAASREMLLVDSDPAALLDRMAAYQPPRVARWLDEKQA